MAGMVGLGGDVRRGGLTMMQHYSSLNEKMRAEQDAMNQAEKAQSKQLKMQYGQMAGMIVGGSIGGLVGALGGSLF